MSFRRAESNHNRRLQEWRGWIDNRRAELIAVGLPPEVYLDADHWYDFLENGHIHWHESSGFEFDDLSPARLAALLRFLEREYGATEPPVPLLRWVRARSGGHLPADNEGASNTPAS